MSLVHTKQCGDGEKKIQWSFEELLSKDRKRLLEFERQIRKFGIIGDRLPKCVFCFHNGDDDGVLVGKLLQPVENHELAVHELCVMTASNMLNQSTDDGPLLGFPMASIFEAFKRAIKRQCYICGIDGASVQCASNRCRRAFHLFCGKRSRKHRTFTVYKDEFNSYCDKHYPELPLSLPQRVMQFPFQTTQKVSEAECSCCMGYVAMRAEICTVVRNTCCHFYDTHGETHIINRYYHFECVQRMAVTAGQYLLKCPFQCGLGRTMEGDYEDVEAERHRQTFLQQITDQGIYVPIRDAQWEIDGSQLHMEPPKAHCHALRCLCHGGRSFSEVTVKEPYPPWELLKCQGCGGKWSHRTCAGEPYSITRKMSEPAWLCDDCKTLMLESAAPQDGSGVGARRISEIPQLICLEQEVPVVEIDDDEDDDDLIIID